jgi:hypothetical protein
MFGHISHWSGVFFGGLSSDFSFCNPIHENTDLFSRKKLCVVNIFFCEKSL